MEWREGGRKNEERKKEGVYIDGGRLKGGGMGMGM